MGIVKSLFRRGGDTSDAREDITEAGEETEARRPEGPQLFMLTPDAAGIAAYQISQYQTAREAEAYLYEHRRGKARDGTIVFWGLTCPPAPTEDGDVIEPVVLIRDVRREGQVYSFSFADSGSAYDFIRHEMKAGLDLGQVSVYWALQVHIAADFRGRATIVQPNSPNRARMHIVARRDPLPAREEAGVHEGDGAPATEDAFETDAEPLPEKLAELEKDELDKVVRILDARGIVLFRNGHSAKAEAEEDGKATAGQEPSERTEVTGVPEWDAIMEGADVRRAEDETVHVQLSDVYGTPTRIVRKTDRGSLNGLGDFGREHRDPDAFLPGGTSAVEEVAAPAVLIDEEKEGGVIGAWANICFAMERALDAHVSQRVVATIAWRRLSVALAEAVTASRAQAAREARGNGSEAVAPADLHGGSEPLSTAWHNGARALRRAAEVQTGRRRLRHAWLNISWTLDEAALAHNLARKGRVVRAWGVMAPALAEAAARKDAMEQWMRTAWRNGSTGALEAAEKQVAWHLGLVSAWSAASEAIHDAFLALSRERGIRSSCQAAGRALGDAAEAKMRHDGMVFAWWVLSTEALAAAEAQESHRSIKLWRFRATGRFEPRDEVFHGFESPPGRF